MSGDSVQAILENLLERAGAEWTQADRDRSRVIAEDSIRLAARDATGQDVSREAAQIRAQLASIAANAEVRASTVVRETVDAVIGAALDRVFGFR